MRPISRRTFLHASSASALGLVAAACGRGSGGDAPKTLNDVIDGRPASMQVLSAGFETFSGSPQRVVFGLRAQDGTFFQGGSGQVWAGRDRDERALGPFPLVFRGEGLDDRGVYVTEMTFPTDGTWLVIVEATPGGGSEQLLGPATLAVGQRTNMPRVGDEAISVATPTFDDARGVDPICTLTPAPCSMHGISLDVALANEKPTALIIATPRFCTSALCGPEVEILDGISKDLGDRIDFVHIELLKDDSNETAERWANNPHPDLFSPGAAAWNISEEPAIYLIDADATIVERIVGPFDRVEAREKVEGLLGA